MRFFKPGLYLRYNSDDDAIADGADREWERAIRAYKEHLATFSAQMNDGVKYVAESLCLHDAEILSFQAEIPIHPLFLSSAFSPGARRSGSRVTKRSSISSTCSGTRSPSRPRRSVGPSQNTTSIGSMMRSIVPMLRRPPSSGIASCLAMAG